MGGVAEGVKEGDDVLVEILGDLDHVGGRDADVLCERAVAVNADGHRVLAPLDVAAAAVAAAMAGDVPFAGDALADPEAFYIGADLGDLTDVLVTDGHGRVLDVLGSPGIPVEDMYVRAADRGLVDLDQDLAGFRYGNRNAAQLKAGSRSRFYDRIH